MKSILKFELTRGGKNKFFALSLIFGCAMTVAGFVVEVLPYLDMYWLLVEKGSFSIPTLFRYWVGTDFGETMRKIFYGVIPLLVALPFADSFCTDCNGYIKNITLRVDKSKYLASKYIAVFTTGGMAVFIPLLANLAVVALFLPAIAPIRIAGVYSIGKSTTFGDLFYSMPFLYVGLYLVIDFVYGGLIACLGLVSSLFIKSRLSVIVMPFILVEAFEMLCSAIYKPELAISNIIDPSKSIGYTPTWALFVYALVLFLITFFPYFFWARKADTL